MRYFVFTLYRLSIILSSRYIDKVARQRRRLKENVLPLAVAVFTLSAIHQRHHA